MGVKNRSCTNALLGGCCVAMVLLHRVDGILLLSETFLLVAESGVLTSMLGSLRPACARLGRLCG